MSLVAYYGSSDSDDDQENSDQTSSVTVSSTVTIPDVKCRKPPPKEIKLLSDAAQSLRREIKSVPLTTSEETVSSSALFSKLPQPTKTKSLVQFTVPLPSEFDSSDDEEDKNKKPKVEMSNIGCGLLSILPQPKETIISSTSFIPNSLKKKNAASTATTVTSTTTLVPNVLRKKNESKEISDSDDDEIAVPESFDEETWQKVCGRAVPIPTKRKLIDTTPISNSDPYFIDTAPPASKPYTGLDNEAFKELIGGNKRRKGDIEIIDIHEDQIRPDKEEFLKSLTDPNCEAPVQIKNPVDNTRKSRNHITALAQKALAHDKDLQIQWSENKFKRGQTRAKYGF